MSKHHKPLIEEFSRGYQTLSHLDRHIAIFGSARAKQESPEYAATMNIAQVLAERGHIITSGGGPGIMQAANEGAKKGGGISVGITIKLPFEDCSNEHIDVLSEHNYFATRKWFLITKAKAIVVCQGGFGTLDEMFATLTLLQTGKIKRKLPIVLFGTEYWQGLIDWLRNSALKHGTISEKDFDLFLVTDDINEAITHIENQL